LAFTSLLVDIRDRLRPLQDMMFPKLVLLEIKDDGVRGHQLRKDAPLPLSLIAPLPPLTCRDGLPLEKEAIGDLIGDLLLNETMLEAYVMAVLPFEASHWRVLVRPFSEPPEDPVRELRRLDPSLSLPFSLRDADFDLYPLPGEPDQLLLVASERKLIDAWLEVFRLAGVKLERLAPAQGCLLAALSDELFDSAANELVAFLMPQGGSCLLWFFHQGIPVFEKILPMDPDDLLQDLRLALEFYHRQEPGLRRLRLLQSAPLIDQDRLEQELGVTGEIISADPYGSLLLKGLAARDDER
jgi:Tfp pilus assembly PilM family ATPase